MGRPTKLTLETKEEGWLFTIGEMLAMIEKAAETDPEARAWLNGEGYIAVTETTSQFKYWHEAYHGGRLTKEAIEWREAVFRRDNYACQECGEKGSLQAHHIIPWAKNKEKRLCIDNGITLCPECHAKKHPKIKGLIKKARYARGERNGETK